MKLFILRHGESGQHQGSDFSRVLTSKGTFDAQFFGKLLTKENIHIDMVLVSPYIRTQQTWTNVSKKYSTNAKVMTENRIASGAPVELAFEVLKELYQDQPQEQTILLVSHQPMITQLIESLVGEKADSRQDFLLAPASFAEIDLVSVNVNGGTLQRIMSPPYNV